MDNNVNAEQCLSQRERIKAYLLKRPMRKLTSLQALQMFECLELPKRISELVKQQGMPINRTEFVSVSNHKKKVKAYFITDEDAAMYNN